jgi:hypothetical protein
MFHPDHAMATPSPRRRPGNDQISPKTTDSKADSFLFSFPLNPPRPFLCGQAVGERRPREEENHAAVKQVYDAVGSSERVHYHWYAGDHDYPPEAQKAAVEWCQRWFAIQPEP